MVNQPPSYPQEIFLKQAVPSDLFTVFSRLWNISEMEIVCQEEKVKMA
jgi:hypothetical protein